MYDPQMNPCKFMADFPRTVDVPGVGPVNSNGSDVEIFWDIKNNHLTQSSDPALGRSFYVNDQTPREYSDLPRYTTAGGLSLIMR
jgi:hypothetical protein